MWEARPPTFFRSRAYFVGGPSSHITLSQKIWTAFALRISSGFFCAIFLQKRSVADQAMDDIILPAYSVRCKKYVYILPNLDKLKIIL